MDGSMVNLIERVDAWLRGNSPAEWVRRRAARLIAGVLAAILIIQWVRLGTAWFAIRRLDPGLQSLVEGGSSEKPDDGKEKEPALKLPEVSQNVFHRSQVSYSFAGMLGDAAIVNDKLVKVGDRVQSATVEEISRNAVKLRTDEGQVRELKAFETIEIKPASAEKKEGSESGDETTQRKWSAYAERLRGLAGP